MRINGKLIGFDMFQSKKGTQCFYGYVTNIPFDHSNNHALGMQTMTICGFGADAQDLYNQVLKQEALNKDVEIVGNRSNAGFVANMVTVQKSK